jgi:hypothetical protein
VVSAAAQSFDVAVTVIHHVRKGAGRVEDSVRGSTSFTGAVEQFVVIEANAPSKHPNRRRLNSWGRVEEANWEKPKYLDFDKATGAYVVVESETPEDEEDAGPGLIERIADFVNSQAGVLATKDIADGIGVNARSKDFKEALSAAALTGQVARVKEGKYGPSA